ncbi:MAG: EAL domain-containing protein [Hyphomicrobiales bacterium]|nr:EAL domain-containing protein [Hyphomicrobiales bacterium]
MQRILLAIGGAAAFCAAVTFLLQVAISRGLPATDIVLVTASATMLLSIGAAAFAYRAFSRANLVAVELERLTRSMDAAIKDVSLRSDRDSTKLDEFNASLSGKMEALTALVSPTDEDEADVPATSRKGKAALPASQPAVDQPEVSAIDVALRRMVAGGQPDLSLQPIIAAGRGEAGGFEVHFHVQPEEGKPVDIRRLERHVADVDPAAYERLAVVAATEAARRRLGDVSEKMPMHIAVSSALLQDGLEFATVLDIFKLHPALAKSVVLSLPAELLQSGQHAGAIELLSSHGVRFACEDWTGSNNELEAIKKAGAIALKIPAERLLDRVKPRKGQGNGAALVAAAGGTGIDIIATDVQSEEDAVTLIDMGVDLVTGERLSAPRRLQADKSGAGRRA